MRPRTPPVVVFVSTSFVLLAVGVAWWISDLKHAGIPFDRWRSFADAWLLAIPIATAGIVTLGIHIADHRLARISNVRPETRHAFQVPRLVQAAAVAFFGFLFSGSAYVLGPMLGLGVTRLWIPHVLFGCGQLVLMYYFAHRFIDIDMLHPEVRPWFLTAMLTLGSAGMATAKFFRETTRSTLGGESYEGPGVTVPLLILAVFAWLGMSYKRRDDIH